MLLSLPSPCGPVPTLSGTDPTARQLYLRRCYYLPQRPRAAWIQVIGHDEVHVYVNGSLVGEQSNDGFAVAVVADLAPYLDVGKNVVAIVARQSSLGAPPTLAKRPSPPPSSSGTTLS